MVDDFWESLLIAGYLAIASKGQQEAICLPFAISHQWPSPRTMKNQIISYHFVDMIDNNIWIITVDKHQEQPSLISTNMHQPWVNTPSTTNHHPPTHHHPPAAAEEVRLQWCSQVRFQRDTVAHLDLAQALSICRGVGLALAFIDLKWVGYRGLSQW